MRGSEYYSQYEAKQYHKDSIRSSNRMNTYHNKYLSLRKTLREYFRENGGKIPDELLEVLGGRNK